MDDITTKVDWKKLSSTYTLSKFSTFSATDLKIDDKLILQVEEDIKKNQLLYLTSALGIKGMAPNDFFTSLTLSDTSFAKIQKQNYKVPAMKKLKPEEFVTIPIVRGFKEIEAIFELTTLGAFICGGYARYCTSQAYNGTCSADDLDIYVRDAKSGLAVKNALEGAKFHIKEETIQSIKYHPRTDNPKFIAAPAINLINPIQLFSHQTFGTSPEEIINQFDFTVCTVALKSCTEAVAHKDFMEHEKERKLVIRNIHNPINVISRIAKYHRKGYNISNSEISKLFKYWEKHGADFKEYSSAKSKESNRTSYWDGSESDID